MTTIVRAAVAADYEDIRRIGVDAYVSGGFIEADGPYARELAAVEERAAIHPVYVADTIGELGLVYRLCPLVFMGGSLVPHGGQNPIEPVKLGAAILHGPNVHNFAEAYQALGDYHDMMDLVELICSKAAIDAIAVEEGLATLAWRELPVDPDGAGIGRTVRGSR